MRLAALMVGAWVTCIGWRCAAAPLEIYGKLPSIEQTALSPDGRALATVVTNGEQRKIIIWRPDTRKITQELAAGAQKVRSLQWAGPNHLIITVSRTGYITDVSSPRSEWYLAVDFNLVQKTQRALLSSVSDALNVIDGLPDIRFIDGHPFAFAEGTVFVQGQGQNGLFKVDLDRGDTATVVTPGFTHTRDYVVGSDGNPLAESEYDANASRWTLKIWRGHWTEVLREQDPIETPGLMGLGRDGVSVLADFSGDDHNVLKELAPATATWSAALPGPAPDRLIWDPATYKLIATSALLGDDERYQFFDPHDQAIWRAITRAYPDSRVSLVSFSADHETFVVRVDSPSDGPAYALVDLTTGHANWLGAEYEGLKPQDIAPVRAIAFKARDGFDLTGYLTLPRGKDARKLPLVVFPHGGPAARDEPGFDWWAQAMASRGYAVLQVNYRGSNGFGWNFLSAGFGQWGRKMQTDLSDGVRYLTAEGIIDPARVCIVGASYGGYAALAGATLDPGVYRCAASVAGVADVGRMVDWDRDRSDVAIERYWLRYMGARSSLAEISPADHVTAATVPILLVHGKDDTVVPYEQSRIMADALTKAGRPVEFVTLKGEDHWLSRGETRLRMLQAVVAFLEKNNPPT
jgi:acetyl esterase/lipase